MNFERQIFFQGSGYRFLRKDFKIDFIHPLKEQNSGIISFFFNYNLIFINYLILISWNFEFRQRLQIGKKPNIKSKFKCFYLN